MPHTPILCSPLKSQIFLFCIFSAENDWWEAKHIVTGKQGFIPSNYVARDDNNPENQE